MPGLRPCAVLGAPCLESEKAFIFACISDVKPLARVAGAGLRAALTGPSGAEDALIPGAEESSECLKEGGLGEGSDDVGDSACATSVETVEAGKAVFVVGSSILVRTNNSAQ